MVENPIVEIIKFDVYTQRTCINCRAEEQGICKIAELQIKLSEKPDPWQAAKADIDFHNIPANCPNGYKRPSF